MQTLIPAINLHASVFLVFTSKFHTKLKTIQFQILSSRCSTWDSTMWDFGASWSHLGTRYGPTIDGNHDSHLLDALLDHLGTILGPSWVNLESSWAHFGSSWSHLGAPYGSTKDGNHDSHLLDALLVILEPSWDHLGSSWSHPGPILEHPEAVWAPVMGPPKMGIMIPIFWTPQLNVSLAHERYCLLTWDTCVTWRLINVRQLCEWSCFTDTLRTPNKCVT